MIFGNVDCGFLGVDSSSKTQGSILLRNSNTLLVLRRPTNPNKKKRKVKQKRLALILRLNFMQETGFGALARANFFNLFRPVLNEQKKKCCGAFKSDGRHTRMMTFGRIIRMRIRMVLDV